MIHAGRLISTGRTSHRRFLSVCFLGYIRRKTLTSSRGGLSRRTQAPSPFPVRPGRPDDRVDGFAGGGGDPRRIPPEPLWSFLQFSPFIFNIDKFTDVYTYKRKPCIPFEHGTAAIARQQERENDSRTRIMVMSSRSVSLSREAPPLSRDIYTSPSFDMSALGPAESDETPRHSVDMNDLSRVCSWRPPSPRKTSKKCRPVSSKRMIGLPRSDSLVESKVRVRGFQ